MVRTWPPYRPHQHPCEENRSTERQKEHRHFTNLKVGGYQIRAMSWSWAQKIMFSCPLILLRPLNFEHCRFFARAWCQSPVVQLKRKLPPQAGVHSKSLNRIGQKRAHLPGHRYWTLVLVTFSSLTRRAQIRHSSLCLCFTVANWPSTGRFTSNLSDMQQNTKQYCSSWRHTYNAKRSRVSSSDAAPSPFALMERIRDPALLPRRRVRLCFKIFSAAVFLYSMGTGTLAV